MIVNFLKKYKLFTGIAVAVTAVVLILAFDEFSDRKKIKITTLDNGIKVITYRMPDKYTSGIALFVEAGSKYDPENQDGISHFMEHLVFSGTTHRTKDEIWTETKRRSIYLNASTGYDDVTYMMRLLKSDLNFGLELISDIIQNPLLDQKEIDRERMVILQEMAIYNNDPNSVLQNLFRKQVYKGMPAERDIIGTTETISKITRENLIDFINANYFGKNMILAVDGNVKHRDVVKLAKKYFGNIKPEGSGYRNTIKASKYLPAEAINFVKKDIDGVYLSLAFKGFDEVKLQQDNNIANIKVLIDILCDGPSARIGKKLRQELGLIYGGRCNFKVFREKDSEGNIQFSFNVNAGKLKEAYDELLKQIEIFPNTLTEGEVKESIEQIKTQLFINEEEKQSTLNVAIDITSDISNFGRYIAAEEMLQNIQKVTKESIVKTWNDYLAIPSQINKPTLTIYGNFDDKKLPN